MLGVLALGFLAIRHRFYATQAIDSRSQIAKRSLGSEMCPRRAAWLREAQLEMQRQQMARSAAIQQMNIKAKREREEAQRIERERRYYACLDPAIDLHGAAGAQMMCTQYR